MYPLLHVRVFGFHGWYYSISVGTMVCERAKPKEARHESRRGFETHGFIKKETRSQNRDQPSQTVER